MNLEDCVNNPERPPIIVSYGGGTDSTAMILACYERQIPVDYIVFSDTGGEKPHTYAYLDLFDVWLQNHGLPKISRVGRPTTLYDQCMKYKTLPSIAFGRKQCSVYFKVRPVHSFLAKQPEIKLARKNGKKIIQLIGYDAGEGKRIKTNEDEKSFFKYPLIEWQITRNDCKNLIEKHGLPQPEKSSCFFCPMNKRHDIIKLKKQYPELIQKALELEKNAVLREGTGTKGLGRGYRWQDLIEEHEYTSKLATLFDEEMPCGCYDGD